MILESPHIKEYNDSGEPLGPALSTTGKNIKNHLIDVLNGAINYSIINLQDGTYAFVLVEAISFQCSNGCDLAKGTNKSKRNCVFSKLWDNEGKQNFIERIIGLNPSLIINSCTGGLRNKDDVDFLNGKINDALNEYYGSVVNTAHPSSYWFWKKGIN